jgi:ElaB/YqjD/DUF883 family membrane-anchored ribosome-binding protein
MPSFDFEAWYYTNAGADAVRFWEQEHWMEEYEGTKKEVEALHGKTQEYKQLLTDAEELVMSTRQCAMEDGLQTKKCVQALMHALEQVENAQRRLGAHQAALAGKEKAVVDGAEQYAAFMEQEARFNALVMELNAIPCLEQQPKAVLKENELPVPGELYLCNGYFIKPVESRTLAVYDDHVVCFLQMMDESLRTVYVRVQTSGCLAVVPVCELAAVA